MAVELANFKPSYIRQEAKKLNELMLRADEARTKISQLGHKTVSCYSEYFHSLPVLQDSIAAEISWEIVHKDLNCEKVDRPSSFDELKAQILDEKSYADEDQEVNTLQKLDNSAKHNLHHLFFVLDLMMRIRVDEETNREGKVFTYAINKNLDLRSKFLALEDLNYKILKKALTNVTRSLNDLCEEKRESIYKFLKDLIAYCKENFDYSDKIWQRLNKDIWS